ncbi:hypothetical protein G6016_14845 [Dietzia aerolata]|uniref:Uncharacterized protein n=1 Tax=Dietzia aerolata TaxID=595984 RepID=A0ABV5JLX9_9ACTN|nr:hypothetical protein [Dietzia aerolata]MBB0970209.1 hypothetical protein [Dietzia aerolata]
MPTTLAGSSGEGVVAGAAVLDVVDGAEMGSAVASVLEVVGEEIEDDDDNVEELTVDVSSASDAFPEQAASTSPAAAPRAMSAGTRRRPVLV